MTKLRKLSSYHKIFNVGRKIDNTHNIDEMTIECELFNVIN